jgi:MOSC domain-containing protein YiiM
MGWKGMVVAIHVARTAGAPPGSLREIEAVEGKGLEGDRYFAGTGTYSAKQGGDRNVTLIEAEAVEALDREYGVRMDPGETRRNIVTRGAALNHLVGWDFRVGDAVLRGIRLCEPCAHMEALSGKKARPGLVHRGGLRACVLKSGRIRVGDHLEPLAPVPVEAGAPAPDTSASH